MLVKRIHAGLALLWLLVVMASGVALWQMNSHSQVPLLRTSVLDFLPHPDYPPRIQPLVDRLAEQGSQNLFVLMTAEDRVELLSAADSLVSSLEKSDRWQRSSLMRAPVDFQQSWQFWLQHAGYLLSDHDRSSLEDNNGNELVRNVVMRYLSPLAMPATLAQQDPLFFLQNRLAQLSQESSFQSSESGWPLMQKGALTATVAVFETSEDVYDMNANEALVAALRNAEENLPRQFPGVSVSATGAVLHIHAGVSQAKQEVSVVGGGSLLAILCLFMWVFRSVTPFLLSVLVLGTGLLVALVVSLAWFGSIHIMSFVFCSSVIGLGVDYCLHYFAHKRFGESSVATLRKVLLPTALGMGSSVMAFVLLAWVPFPGFQQMAVLTALGLVCVWVTLCLWIPWLDRGLDSVVVPRFLQFSRQTDAHEVKTGGFGPGTVKAALVSVPVLAVLLFAAFQVKPDDDLRQLQAPQPGLTEVEDSLSDWLGWRADTAYFLIEHEQAETVLQRGEQLCKSLRVDAADAVDKVRCVTDWLPSQKTQQQDHQLLQQLLGSQPEHASATWSELRSALQELGMPDDIVNSWRQSVLHDSHSLTPDQLMQSPMAVNLGLLWQQNVTDKTGAAMILPLSGVRDAKTLAALANPEQGIYWIDPVRSLSDLIRTFREHAATFVLLGYLVIVVLMGWRYGIRRAMTACVPILLGVLCVLAVAGIGVIPFNVFSVLALILVMGMGMDYGLFFLESRGDVSRTRLAVLVSAITTLLAFGLLALSRTTAISSFGLAIVIGLVVVLITTFIFNSNNNFNFKGKS